MGIIIKHAKILFAVWHLNKSKHLLPLERQLSVATSLYTVIFTEGIPHEILHEQTRLWNVLGMQTDCGDGCAAFIEPPRMLFGFLILSPHHHQNPLYQSVWQYVHAWEWD